VSTILVVEDNRNLAAGLRQNLEVEGHEVVLAASGAEGLEAFERAAPDLVILDLMLPGMDGFEVLARLRRRRAAQPVLLLTARGAEADKVRGLRGGADDYVTKPFGVLELLARVDALLRRTSGPAIPADEGVSFAFGRVEVDVARRAVLRDGAEVGLTPKEFDLLLALLRADGAAVSRGALMREVWGYRSDVLSRTVDTHVAELRRKLEDVSARPAHLITVRKVGYRLVR